MRKATMSFEKSREALVKAMSNQAGQDTVEKTVRFEDEDVPKYLSELAKFQDRSRKVRLVVQ